MGHDIPIFKKHKSNIDIHSPFRDERAMNVTNNKSQFLCPDNNSLLTLAKQKSTDGRQYSQFKNDQGHTSGNFGNLGISQDDFDDNDDSSTERDVNIMLMNRKAAPSISINIRKLGGLTSF